MASHLNATEFQIGNTQIITGISTSVTSTDSSLSTSKAIKDFMDNSIKPISLTVSGNWDYNQYISSPVNTTGLTFTVTYGSGKTASVTPNISPSKWSSTVGTQTATFSHTERGVTVSASKSASVVNPLLIPLTLQAREAGNISITKYRDTNTVYYSKNGGSQTTLDSGVNIPVSTGDKVSFYRTLSSDLQPSKYITINCTNNCYVYGNVMSFYNKDNFANLTTIGYEYAFYRLFYSNAHIDINESVGKLLLPATTLAARCYSYMFEGSGITTAPVLPATTLAAGCYSDMFGGSGITTAPVLPATTLAESCYSHMFSDCLSLTTVQVLPATTLAVACYSGMFSNCLSLTTVPSNMLPATTLAQHCYMMMFGGSGITTAPVLPATTLAESCYGQMFIYCNDITSITCLATNISAERCTDGWLYNASSSGTFTTPSSTPWTTGYSGIPSGWTRVNA